MSEQLKGAAGGFAGAIAGFSPSLVRVAARRRHPASGIVWLAEGVIVTADHVIEQEDEIRVGLDDGREVPAVLVGRDPATDVAALRIDVQLSPAIRAPEPRLGDLLVVAARPGSAVEVSLGIVSATGSASTRRGARLDGYLRLDATLYPGFSGGGAVDSEGRVLGMATSLLGRGDAVALSTATVDRVVSSLVRHGRVRGAFLGVATQRVAIRGQAGFPSGHALLVVGLEGDGPAEQAGLLVGDLITRVGDAAVDSAEALRLALPPELIGAEVSVHVVRGGVPAALTVTIGERP
ncbi:MAG: S1C family serine protease [Chloroflexota bacterium]